MKINTVYIQCVDIRTGVVPNVPQAVEWHGNFSHNARRDVNQGPTGHWSEYDPERWF